jgi:hypothetical protein
MAPAFRRANIGPVVFPSVDNPGTLATDRISQILEMGKAEIMPDADGVLPGPFNLKKLEFGMECILIYGKGSLHLNGDSADLIIPAVGIQPFHRLTT